MPKFYFSVSQLESMNANPWYTDRERAVFDLYFRRGWAIEDIAAELYVSRGTVNNDLKHIRQKNMY